MSKCPICKEDNQCAVPRGEDPNTCWCMKVTIPKELLEKVLLTKVVVFVLSALIILGLPETEHINYPI